MSTTAYKGRDALIKISADGGSTFSTVGGVRTNALTINNEPVDVTNAGSNGFREHLADGGVQSVSMSCDGLVVDNTAFETMMTQAKDRTLVRYKFEFATGGIIAAPFVVTSIQLTGTYNDAQSFSAQLESSGSVSITAPT
jgi:TP901-1 family phage major tail protein